MLEWTSDCKIAWPSLPPAKGLAAPLGLMSNSPIRVVARLNLSMAAQYGASSNLSASAHRQLKLSLLPGNFAICKFVSATPFPVHYLQSSFLSITKTDTELSVVCDESAVPPGVTAQRGRRALRVEGPLDFSLTGVLASIVAPLATAEVSIFVLSTYDTDYLLIAGSDLDRAVPALEQAGHTISRRKDQ